MTTKGCLTLETFSTFTLTKSFRGMFLPTSQTLIENPGGFREESWWSFRRQIPNLIGFLIVFNGIKWVTMALKKLHLWLKKI